MARSSGVSLVLAAGLLACGCAGRGGSSFPIGLYHVDDPKALAEAASAGFSAVETARKDPETLTALGKEARRRGLSLFVSPLGLMRSSAPASGMPILAWYLWDEPEVSRTSSQTLRELRDEVRKWDSRPIGLTIGTSEVAKTYADIPDVLAVDWYPVPHLPLASFGDHVARAVREAGPDKPVWGVVQAMDWRDFPEGGKKGVGRFPSIYEMRFMAYDAVAQGARGLWFFTFSKPNGKTLADFPEQWLALRTIAGELRMMARVFGEGRRATLPFPPDPDSVEARAWRWRGRTFVLVLNRKADKLQKMPPELLNRRWRPLFEPHRDVTRLLVPRGRTWYLPQHRVLLFEGPLRP